MDYIGINRILQIKSNFRIDSIFIVIQIYFFFGLQRIKNRGSFGILRIDLAKHWICHKKRGDVVGTDRLFPSQK